MSWKAQIDESGRLTRYKDSETGEVISDKEYARRMQMQTMPAYSPYPSMQTGSPMMMPQPMYGGHPGAAQAYPQTHTGRPLGQDISTDRKSVV